jgi:hypothetical protein
MENIYNKISKIQKEIGKLKKDKQNPFFKSNYVDINGILEQLNPLLEKEGLVLIQPLSNVEGRPALKTILTDGTDKIEETTLLPDLQDPQKMGSAVTYYRRYSIQSLFALLAEDDDANLASGKKTNEKAF